MSALPTDKQVAVIGAGTMGAGIAQVAAQAGHVVLLYDAAPGSAQMAIDNIRDGLEGLVKRGKFTPGEVHEIIARLTPVGKINDLSPAALIIEAIVEDIEIKQALFKELEAVCDDDTILATNTSSLSVTAFTSSLSRPENFIGMHFFNPAQIMKLVEVISGSSSSCVIAETVFHTAESWGKKPVHSRSTPGFIVNRVARPFYAEALRVLEEGAADAATIDGIMRESAGFRMGPFELMDLIGNDVNLAVTTSVFKSFHNDPRFKPSLFQEDLVASGKFGRKSSQGFYDYADGAINAEASTADLAEAPKSITIYGDLGIAAPLADLIKDARISTLNKVSDDDHGYISVGSAHLCLCNGSFASESGGNTIFFDLALDYAVATRIALAPSDTCDLAAIESAVGFFQALGKTVSIIDDIPGMVAMRTVCMLANEGSDAVHQKVCSEQAVDTAMRYGVNYPSGPLEWADRIGLEAVQEVLDNMALIYGDGRYRCSPLIVRKILSL